MANKVIRTSLFVWLCLLAGAAHAILPIQHWQTQRGAKVYFVENRDLPMVDVSVEVPAGSAYDRADKAGTASLTNQMLRLGAGKLNEDEVSRRLADVGAVIHPRFDRDRGGLAVRTLSSRAEREAALGVFAVLLQQPTFPQSAFERERSQLVTSLREADTKPDTIARVTFSQLSYPGHPYGQRSNGTPDTVAKLQRQDLVEFHRRHYAAEHAIVAIMGDVSRDEAAAIAEQVTAGLPAAGSTNADIPPVKRLDAPVTRYVAHPATQSHVLVGGPGMSRSDPDYFALFVGNYVLGGGGFVSRIMDEVRQKRGLAYSAGSNFVPLRREGPFVISLQTQRDQVPQALEVVRNVLSAFVKNGPTPKELQAAKDNIIGGFPLRIDSNRKIHEYLSMIGFYGLPLTYLDDFIPRVEKVTAADIQRAFASHIDPERLVTVVVGPGEEKALASAPAR